MCCKLELCELALWLWETDATGLPVTKKRPERAVVAFERGVSGFGAAFLEATATDVLQVNFLVFVFMSLLFPAAILLVELHVDDYTLHI